MNGVPIMDEVLQRPSCGECKWWDKTTDYDGRGKIRKCSNPKCPGYKMWREYKNHLCKGYWEPIEQED